MARPTRNFSGVQFQALRERIDRKFCDLHDSLEEAYYGDRGEDGRWVAGTGWRNGQSSPWYGFDVLATPEQSKAQFDEIHAFLHAAYLLIFHEENQEEATPYSRDAYDYRRDEGGNITESRVAGVRSRLRWLKNNRPAIFNKLKTWAQNNGFTFNEEATD